MFYLYNTDNIYIGMIDFLDPDVYGDRFTNVQPESSDHVVWDGSTWQLEVDDTPTFEMNVEAKIASARGYFEQIAQSAASNCAPFELDSWETQRSEWLRWKDDVTAITPYIDMLCLQRSMAKADLMARIENNVLGFAYIQGQLHHLEDLINACTTQEQLDQIVW